MVSNSVYRIIERAVVIRIENGEDSETVIDSYTRLSEDQAKKLKEKYVAKE